MKLGGENELVQWCHGAPGFLYLLAELHSICQSNSEYNRNLPLVKQIANKCLDTTWREGVLKKGKI